MNALAAPLGHELILDLSSCDPDTICDGAALRVFASQLCDQLDVYGFTEPTCERFALHDPSAAGYSITQVTALTTLAGHFAENSNRAFINIFSRQRYDTESIALFVADYFHGTAASTVLTRGTGSPAAWIPISVGTPQPASATAEPWGYELILDLFDCDGDRLNDREVLRSYVIELVDCIGMTAHGEPFVARFLPGHTLTQLITTSNITVVATEPRQALCVNVFSCKEFDARVAAEFSQEYFNAATAAGQVLLRGAV